jgi:hypothetical protein
MDLIRLNAITDAPIDDAPHEKSVNLQYSKLVEQRDMKLSVLAGLRSANEEMKREIGRISFQLRYHQYSHEKPDLFVNRFTIGAQR